MTSLFQYFINLWKTFHHSILVTVVGCGSDHIILLNILGIKGVAKQKFGAISICNGLYIYRQQFVHIDYVRSKPSNYTTFEKQPNIIMNQSI